MNCKIVIFLVPFIIGAFKTGEGLKFCPPVTEDLIHDRSQVFASVEFGGLREIDYRHFMGVLIHPMYIVTAGPTLAETNQTNRVQVRLGSTWSFQVGQIKELVWWTRTQPDTTYDDDRFTVYLGRLGSPFYDDRYSSLAFVESNHYGRVNCPHQRLSGFHGYDGYSLNHVMNFMAIKHADGIFCTKFYDDVEHIVHHHNVKTNIARCVADISARAHNDYADKKHPEMNDDGAGLFITHKNVVIALALGRMFSPQEERTTITTYLMRYQRSMLQHLKASNKDIYGDFPEDVLRYHAK